MVTWSITGLLREDWTACQSEDGGLENKTPSETQVYMTVLVKIHSKTYIYISSTFLTFKFPFFLIAKSATEWRCEKIHLQYKCVPSCSRICLVGCQMLSFSLLCLRNIIKAVLCAVVLIFCGEEHLKVRQIHTKLAGDLAAVKLAEVQILVFWYLEENIKLTVHRLMTKAYLTC